ADRRKGKASFRRVPLKTVEEVLRLYQEKYYDLNVRHFREKLAEEHSTVNRAAVHPVTSPATS
ncbi:MAG TPA: hypothetical protein VN442_05555, partial [Bryobacteraceae bacterium]|nr:hypothetical protein [Bryobacteraceae bacterium]